MVLETTLQVKYPVEYHIFTRGLQEKFRITYIDLKLERHTSNHLKAENEARLNLLEKQEQLLQQRASELDAQRTALDAADQELRDVKAKNKALEDNLQHVQDDLAQSLWMASNLAARLNGARSTVKRRRIREEGSSASPSGRDQKRARDGSRDSPDRNSAKSPILLD
jgi:hypothetical protein